MGWDLSVRMKPLKIFEGTVKEAGRGLITDGILKSWGGKTLYPASGSVAVEMGYVYDLDEKMIL